MKKRKIISIIITAIIIIGAIIAILNISHKIPTVQDKIEPIAKDKIKLEFSSQENTKSEETLSFEEFDKSIRASIKEINWLDNQTVIVKAEVKQSICEEIKNGDFEAYKTRLGNKIILKYDSIYKAPPYPCFGFSSKNIIIDTQELEYKFYISDPEKMMYQFEIIPLSNKFN